MKPHHFFYFFPFWGFLRKTEKKKTQFSFSNCKNSQFCASKKKFFSDFTLGNRHLLNSRETVSSFTAVSLKLTWNSKNGQSFTETGCQKYGVFGIKSAKSTVSFYFWLSSSARNFQIFVVLFLWKKGMTHWVSWFSFSMEGDLCDIDGKTDSH